MVYTKGVGIFGYAFETCYKGVGKAIGDLQADAQQHGEEKEDGHLFLFEQREGTQPQLVGNAFTLGATRCGTCGQRKAI